MEQLQITTNDRDVKIARSADLTAEQVAIIKNTVVKRDRMLPV
jgi:hypothetical protein